MSEAMTPYVILEEMPPTQEIFLGFTMSHDTGTAVKYFVDRYGQQPANIIRWKGNIYLGPVPKNSERESEK